MREYFFDLGLMIFGGLGTAGSFWLLLHISDRRLLRRLQPPFPFVKKLTHDETVAQRSIMLAFPALIGLFIGIICLLVGALRLFGVGR
jgi:hypothetical protein